MVLSTGTAEQVTTDLSRAGIEAAVRVLAGSLRAPASVDFAARPRPCPLRKSSPTRSCSIASTASRRAITELSSRIVYSAAMLDLDDRTSGRSPPASISSSGITRVKKSITRVAWNGTRPVVSEVARAWAGTVDGQDLRDADLATRASTPSP